MTVRRSESTWVPVTMPRRLAAGDITAVLMGVIAALGGLVLTRTVLASGVAGIDIFEPSSLERLAASTVATAIGLVFASFFCGGWAYGALRGRKKRGSLEDFRYGETNLQDPARWAGAGSGRSMTTDDGTSMKWDRRGQVDSSV